MAGKHQSIGEAGAQAFGEGAMAHPADRLYLGYSEGRATQVAGGVIDDNPFPTWMIEQRAAWNAGFFSTSGEQFETAYVT